MITKDMEKKNVRLTSVADGAGMRKKKAHSVTTRGTRRSA